MLGSTRGLEMPNYAVVHKAVSYEVRRYAPSIVAECNFAKGGWGEGDDGSPFGVLARYIGVFGKPENLWQSNGGTAEPIAMTAPVIVTAPEPISMTAPVLVSPTQGDNAHTMAFVLPASRFQTVAAAPQPTDSRVTLRQLPERLQAVRTYSWNFRPDSAKEQLAALLADLQTDGWAVKHTAAGHPEWQAAGYNPPFALPFLKRNEVLVSVEEKPN